MHGGDGMAESSIKIASIISRYQEQLYKMNITCKTIYLFGSYATGNPHEGSDIDLIVVSSNWEGVSMRERREILGIAAARILEPIQATGFTEAELKEESLSQFWKNILKNSHIAC